MVSDEIDFHVMNIKKIGDIMNLSPYKVLKNHQNPPVRRVPMKNPAKIIAPQTIMLTIK